MNVHRSVYLSAAIILTAVILPAAAWGYTAISAKIEPAAVLAAKFVYGDFSTSGKKSLSNIFSESTSSVRDTYSQNKSALNLSDELSKLSDSSSKGDSSSSALTKSFELPSEQPSQAVLSAIPYKNGTDNDGVIKSYTFTKYTEKQYFNLESGAQVRNCTTISNANLLKESQSNPDFVTQPKSAEPQVLIYHTHATESFEKTEKTCYDNSFSCKTTNRSMSIVSVGDEICKQLDKAGIAYVHDTLIHDYPSYDNAYDSSRSAVKKILKQYPSIKICIDCHRDGIQRSDGTRLAPTTLINGKKAAQIMLICGCDDGTMNMPNYMKNFHFACAFQSQLETDYSGLTRPILFDYRFYNQDLTTGSLLIEVGSQANSIEQVKYSGQLVGSSLSALIKKLGK